MDHASQGGFPYPSPTGKQRTLLQHWTEKRQRLRDYYELYYGRMAVMARSTEMRSALDRLKIAHLSQITQARVRHETDSELPTPSPTPKKKKDKRARKYEANQR